MEEKQKYQYWLRCIKGVGNKKQKKLVEYCGSANEVYGLTRRQLGKISEIYEKEINAILESKKSWDLEKEASVLEQADVNMVTLEEEAFPKRLKNLADCPYALFFRGRLPEEGKKTAAIVGARACSSYGRAVALELGEKLARQGADVISGMASGVDSFGHWGAIHGGGRTYAVMGCGADVCYPRGGRELYHRIQEAGGILSEYLPKTEPAAMRFPARNRLISALSDVVIVVEARRKSGSLITADFALEQGKEIYAVPGRLDDALSAGCNDLIRQGAGILSSVEELLLELGFSGQNNRVSGKKDDQKIINSLEKAELMVYSCFGLYAKNMEELLQMTKLPAWELADLLVKLQAKGLIEEFYKNHYRKIGSMHKGVF